MLVLKNKSYAVTAEVAVPEGGADGTIVAQGGAFGGWSLYANEGSPRTATTSSACSGSRSTARTPIPAGEHQVRMEFAYDGGGLGKGGTATLYVDGTQVGEGRVDATVPMVFSADETADVGTDAGTPVTDDLRPRAGRLHRPGALGADRPRRRRRGRRPPDLPEERYRIAMARQ